MACNALVLPAAAVRDPKCWGEIWEELMKNAVSNDDQICLCCDVASPLNSNRFKAQMIRCVRTLPRLIHVKNSLKRILASTDYRSDFFQRNMNVVSPNGTPVSGAQFSRGPPAPTIWSVNRFSEDSISVTDALSGVTLMQIRDPKKGVMVTALLHAPFRGFINRKLELIPICKPHDILDLHESSLINTDYVWVGFRDGTIRLFPADPRSVKERDRSMFLSKGELADLVFELPKYHKGSILSITRSPCHEDDKTVDLVMANRLSSSICALTAAAPRDSLDGREHLSLICTASEDSCIVVWDMQKIYRRLEEMQQSSRKAVSKGHPFGVSQPELGGDVVSFSFNSQPGMPECTMRSTCTMVKMRALFKLKGGVGGLRTMKWVTTTVTTVGYKKSRDAVAMTRDPKESTAPKIIRSRHAVQHMTRWEKREEHRMMLRLSEIEMREVEEELMSLMPPLAPEPVQKRRINLILAGDVHGVVHIWDLDEELERNPSEALQSSASITRSCSASFRSQFSVTPVSSFNFSPSVEREHDCDNMSQKSGSVRLRSQRVRNLSNERSQSSHPNSPTPCLIPNASKLGPRHQSETKFMRDSCFLFSSVPRKMQSSRSKKKKSRTVDSATYNPWENTLSVFSASNLSLALRQTRFRDELKFLSNLSVPDVLTRRNLTGGPDTGRLHSVRSCCSNLTQEKSHVTKNATPVSECMTARSFKFSDGWTSNVSNLCFQTKPLQVREKVSVEEKMRIERRGALNIPNVCSFSKMGSTISFTRVPPSNQQMRTSTGIPERNAKRKSMPGSNPQVKRRGFIQTRRKFETKTFDLHDSLTMVGSSPLVSPLSLQYSVTGRKMDTCVSPLSFSDSLHSLRKENKTPTCMPDSHRFNDMCVRKAKFTVNLTDCATVTGIAVDLPALITVTMRCLPDPQEPHYSLLERPTAEEMLHRKLANTFDELTGERALFHALSNLQFYVSVDGNLLNMSCVPKAQESSLATECPLSGSRVDGNGADTASSFVLLFQRQILDRHSQSIPLLFIDRPRHQLWVARNDGPLSVFSTRSKKIMTRIPHPSATTALSPPSKQERKEQQRKLMLRKWRQFHLERHEKHPSAHFVDLLPISVIQEFKFILVSVVHEITFHSDFDSTLTDTRCTMRNITVIDGRETLSQHARGRESGLSRFLETLKVCRQNAVSVRRAQRDYYNSVHNDVSVQMAHIISKCVALDALHAGKRAFRAWMRHRERFPRHYVFRHLLKKRWVSFLRISRVMGASVTRKLRVMYFTNWLSATYNRKAKRLEAWLTRHLVMRTQVDRMMDMLMFLVNHERRRHFWLLWRSILVSPSPAARSINPTGGLGAQQTPTPRTACASKLQLASCSRGPGRDEIFSKFYAVVWHINALRPQLIRFYWDERARSVLDAEDFWFESIESAASEAETHTVYARKLAVFKYALLPMLLGLLSTAEGMMLHMSAKSISNDMRSMVRGCLMCVDYIYADNECLTNALEEVDEYSYRLNNSQKRHQDLKSNEELQRAGEMRSLFDDAIGECEFQSQLVMVAAQQKVIDGFVRICSF